MEDDAFGRCYVACMNRCADDGRRDPAICPGAREAAPRSATSSAPPSAGPPTSTWSLLISGRGRITPSSPQPPRVVRRSAASYAGGGHAGGRRKWNRHAERGVGGEGKLNRRADPHGRRDKSLYRVARLLSWRGAPAGPRGRARVCRFAAWVGAGEPRPNALHEEEEGARPQPGRRPSPGGPLRLPGSRAPLVRPELKGGILANPFIAMHNHMRAGGASHAPQAAEGARHHRVRGSAAE